MIVTIYSTPTCGYCKLAKEYFKENNVEYTEVDLSLKENEARMEEMVQKSGQMGVPVIIVENDGKEEIVIGFDQEKLAPLLGL